MKVRLLKDIVEKDREGRDVGIKTTARRGQEAVQFTKGIIIDMSPASAQKYVDKGWGEIVAEDAPAKKEVRRGR